MADRSARRSLFDEDLFRRAYGLSLLVTIIVGEVAGDIWWWHDGFESSTHLPRIVSAIHLAEMTALGFPIYLLIAGFVAFIPVVLLFLLARIFVLVSLSYYVLSGIIAAALPSYVLLQMVNGLCTRRARLVFMIVHSLWGIVGGIVFRQITQRHITSAVRR